MLCSITTYILALFLSFLPEIYSLKRINTPPHEKKLGLKREKREIGERILILTSRKFHEMVNLGIVVLIKPYIHIKYQTVVGLTPSSSSHHVEIRHYMHHACSSSNHFSGCYSHVPQYFQGRSKEIY